MRIFVFLAVAILVAGCALKPTEYGESGTFSHEGYSEEEKAEGIFQLSFTGVGHEDPALIEELLERRAAEIAVREGFDWFSWYARSRNDLVLTGAGRKSVPRFYGTIHLHKGAVGEDGFDARVILARPLPVGVILESN